MVERLLSPKRKAISTILGSFFFLVLMFAVFGAILLAFQYQSQMVVTQEGEAKREFGKIQERFSITPSKSGSSLSLKVKNTGTPAVEVADVWIIDKGQDSKPTLVNVPSGYSFVPGGAEIDVLAGNPPPIGGGTYIIKAVSALGNIATAELKPTGPGDPGNTLEDKLVGRPFVYAAFPNPIISDKKGYIALTLANPTPHEMWINRTSLQIISPTNPGFLVALPSSGIIIDASPNKCWESQSAATTIVWSILIQDACTTSAEKINKYSAREFKLNFTAKNFGQSQKINTINTNSFSTFGQFGGTKLDTVELENNNCAVPNISQSSSGTNGNAIYSVSNILETTNHQYNVTLRNTGDSETTKIKVGATILINVHKDWTITQSAPTDPTEFALVNPDGTTAGASVIQLQDGSWQIRVKLLKDVGGTGNPLFRTYTFRATAPDVDTSTLYLMYLYAVGYMDGPSTGSTCGNNKLMGPVAETVVQVCKDATCG